MPATPGRPGELLLQSIGDGRKALRVESDRRREESAVIHLAPFEGLVSLPLAVQALRGEMLCFFTKAHAWQLN